MRKIFQTIRLPLMAGTATLLVAGAAYAAARDHVLNVSLADGSVAQIHYQGDVAPRVVMVPAGVQPAAGNDAAAMATDPFLAMDREFAAMQAQQDAMLRQVAEMQRAAAAAPSGRAPNVVSTSTGAPNGVFQYQMISTTTGANGCTQTVEWRSDGRQAEPQVTQTSAGDCRAVTSDAPAHPAAEVRQDPQARLPANDI